jgi:hypothetical protein
MCNPKPKKAIMKNKSCENRIDTELMSRLDELKRLLSGERCEDIGELQHYALSFDYVAPGTFDDQAEGYLRYQISWGGPSDEFRFYINPDLSIHRIEYWLLDWFDGASRICTTNETALQLWQWLVETGSVAFEMRRAAL